ncbi:apoptotic chromatin condensation inducer in the nucleus [Sipha flava]|uniref:Apoptotic chromatin condensation inducer in the nucleus n=2 Tax=Sipha flava TaxID=143950 RepID=A0A8B8FVT3_9HEMI|nr:apoptotic chromatin condensation inducer in the nucleus [Sipha flava]
MSKRTGRKPKRERTSRRRTRRHSSTSETSSEDVPPKTRATSRVDEVERKVALTIKLPKPESNDCNEENTTGMWKVECSNGSDGDIQKLKISLRRSPKDLLREQAAEAKYAAERKEKEEAASSSTHSSALDGSVTNYLEQFGSTVVVKETEQNIVDSNEQVKIVIPANEPTYNQGNISQIDNNQIDDSKIISDLITSQDESIVKNISIDKNMLIDEVVSDTVVKSNVILENTVDQTTVAVESINPINLSEDLIGSTVNPLNEECQISEEKLTNVEVIPSDIDIPIALSETIQDVNPEFVENIVSEINVSKVIEEENESNAEISKTANDIIEEKTKSDLINDSEQMEDVVQLTVESPDLVDDEDPKPAYEEELKPIDKETKPVVDKESISVDNKESITVEEPKLVCDKESKPIVESYPVQLLDTQKVEVEEVAKSSSSHPKRKWGSCKTRTPITISPFTLGIIIESNSDFIGDNSEYRSEEGEIQRTDSEEEQDVEEAMEMNDTMLIDHEAVDYEAPDEEEKPSDIDDDECKSEKSLTEEVNKVEPKKNLSAVKHLTSNVIRITNLVRPFTVGQLRDLLQRTGKIVSNGFWIDSIKSQCIVEYENEDQAIETVYALNESQWPSTNPKFLRVVFTDKEELNKALNGTQPDRLEKQNESKVEKLRTRVENNIILREWDRGKLEDMNGEKEDKPTKRKISDDHFSKDKKVKKDLQDKQKKSKTPERIPTKSLDELFRKTKTSPTLYWSPLSLEQITEKEDQRRKHLAEMERSQKTDRRRRDNNNIYPRRR